MRLVSSTVLTVLIRGKLRKAISRFSQLSFSSNQALAVRKKITISGMEQGWMNVDRCLQWHAKF